MIILSRRTAFGMLGAAATVEASRPAHTQVVELELQVELSEDRNQTGHLTLKRAGGQVLAGPFPVFGRSDNATAAAHGNSGRDPTKLYGDTPSGTYDVPQAVRTGDGTAYGSRSYGSNGALVLKPKSGQAKTAEANGRVGLLVHGGAPGTGGRLRATHGCLRLSNDDMARLVAAVIAAGQNPRFNRCELVRLSATIGPPGDPVSGEDVGDPPPGIAGIILPGPIQLP